MKRNLKWLWIVVEVIIVIYVVFVTSFILFKNKYGFTQFGNYTMASINEVTVNYLNDAKDGNLLVVKNSDDIKKGDLIYYYTPIETEYVIKNGVVADIVKSGNTGFYTLEDDSGTTVVDSRILGTDAKQYRFLGSIIDVLEGKLGFLLLVLLPIIGVFAFQIYQLITVLRDDSKDMLLEDEKDKSKEEVVENDIEITEEVVNEEVIEDKKEEEDIEII